MERNIKILIMFQPVKNEPGGKTFEALERIGCNKLNLKLSFEERRAFNFVLVFPLFYRLSKWDKRAIKKSCSNFMVPFHLYFLAWKLQFELSLPPRNYNLRSWKSEQGAVFGWYSTKTWKGMFVLTDICSFRRFGGSQLCLFRTRRYGDCKNT